MTTPLATRPFLAHSFDFAKPAEPDLARWFEPAKVKVSEADGRAALDLVVQWARKHFDKRINMQRTPTGFGRELLLHALPEGVRYETLDDGLADVLDHHLSTPHRVESFQRIKGKAYEHDARVAYLAHCRSVPVFLRGRCIIDEKNVYDGYRQGFYCATVTVPTGWEGIGLVHAEKTHLGDQPTYRFPRTPGETFTSWFHQEEIGLLQEKHWPYVIQRRMLFAEGERGLTGLDPLRLWRERFVDAILHAERLQADDPKWRIFRYAVRVAALHTIGAFHPTSKEAGLYFDGEQWREEEKLKLNTWNMRWRHPEWFCAITARTRVMTTRKALALPLNQIVAITGDAILTTQPIPGMVDDGRVGAYRLKGMK